jgi:Bacterial regulatory helix-turn-helix protein, lysR family/LysR substrate binding domain
VQSLHAWCRFVATSKTHSLGADLSATPQTIGSVRFGFSKPWPHLCCRIDPTSVCIFGNSRLSCGRAALYTDFSIIAFESNNLLEKAIIDIFFLAYVDQVRVEIELRKMQYFLAIAEERSFTRAAKRCHVAPASLSRQIRSMEIGLEAQLFERLPRDIRLTQAGRVFRKQASKALEHSHRAVSLVRSLKREKDQKLRIGLSTLCDLPRLRALVETARKSTEQIAVDCITAYTSELLLALHRGRLDIAVVDLPAKSSGIAFYPIQSEPLIVVLPQNHPLAQRPMIRYSS